MAHLIEVKETKLTSRVFSTFSLDRILGKLQKLEAKVDKQETEFKNTAEIIKKADDAFKKCITPGDLEDFKKSFEIRENDYWKKEPMALLVALQTYIETHKEYWNRTDGNGIAGYYIRTDLLDSFIKTWKVKYEL